MSVSVDTVFLHPPPASASPVICACLSGSFLSAAWAGVRCGPRAIQASHSRLTIRTMLGRLGCRNRRRSSIMTSPSLSAARKALRVVVIPTPARAAMASSVNRQSPRRRASSQRIRIAASSPCVKFAAIAAGITPEAASLRRRSRDATRSGEVGRLRRDGKQLGFPCAFAAAATAGARCATVSSPRTSRRRAATASARA